MGFETQEQNENRHMNLVNQSSESTAISSHNRNHNARSSNQRARSMFTTHNTTVNHNRNKPPSQQKLCFGSSGFQLGPLRNDAHIAFTPTQSTQNPHIHNEDDLNDAHKLWSVMKKEGTLIFFGCHVCKSHDKHGTLKWSKEQWPVTITRMLFSKLRHRTLSKSWLPSVHDREKMMLDMIKQCLVDGVRAIKTDERSVAGSVAYNNWMKERKANAIALHVI
eukprot:248774_1